MYALAFTIVTLLVLLPIVVVLWWAFLPYVPAKLHCRSVFRTCGLCFRACSKFLSKLMILPLALLPGRILSLLNVSLCILPIN